MWLFVTTERARSDSYLPSQAAANADDLRRIPLPASRCRHGAPSRAFPSATSISEGTRTPAMFRICGGICPPMPLLVNCCLALSGARSGVPMGTTTPDVRVTLGPGLLPRSVRGRALGDAGRADGRPAPPGRPVDGKSAMTLRPYIPIDAAALAAGARQVTSASARGTTSRLRSSVRARAGLTRSSQWSPRNSALSNPAANARRIASVQRPAWRLSIATFVARTAPPIRSCWKTFATP